MQSRPILHLFCGKAASGKSTLAKALADEPGTILLREDFWLSGLFGDELTSLPDYVRYSAHLRRTITPHVIDLLQAGLSVVLDWPANTRKNRLWMRQLFEAAGSDHQLHVFDVPDEVCKARLRRRNASGEHEFSVSEAAFDQISSYFQPPEKEEGFNLVLHTVDGCRQL
ncbi:AAA family ATPase [Roseibium sp.]|uniref:AAA family ATPase n=1 Tax=Roseibium sp. TaxID=1936156 RepID=UPI003D11370A